MPIRLTNKRFTDRFGNTLSFLQANTMDYIEAEFDVEESISVDTVEGNTLTNNGASDIITWIGGNFEEEGFRVGQTVNITRYTIATGVVLDTTTTTVDWVIDEQMKVATTLGSWYTLPDEAVSIFAQASREGVELNLNMVGNGSQGNEYSLIDGTARRTTIDLTTAPPNFSGVDVGEQSGMFSVDARMILDTVASTTTVRYYTLYVDFVLSGLYNSTLYDFNNCLKLYVKQKWQTLLGEPYLNTIDIYNDDADTGWFNEAFNLGSIDATLVQGVDEISYCDTTQVTFVVDSSASNRGVGGAYVSGDDLYYKVKPNTQSQYAMTISTTPLIVGQNLVSQPNDDNAQWFWETLAINTVGTIHTITGEITPNPAFATFMANRNQGDRTFYLWCRWGDVNLLVFNGQLTCTPTATQPLEMVVSDYFDHSENVTDSTDLIAGYTGNIEDEFAFVGKFRFGKKITSQFVNIKIEAYNITSEESFTLQSANFNLTNIPQDNTPFEAYILNEQTPVLTELPTTSVKRIATLERDTSIDLAVEYGVKIYFPYIYRWETWISQLNADSDFYPNDQTRNYVPYGNQGDWHLRLVIDNSRTVTNAYGIDELVNFQYTDYINIDDYDHNPNVAQDIQLYIDATSQNVTVVTEGQLMRIVATHTMVDGSAWITDRVWGMITVEPTESNPRWISSTAIDYDNNIGNPLTPLSGLRCDLTFPTPDVARLECFFNPDKINLSNGVKFTSKIKGCNDGDVIKLATDGQQKTTTLGNKKSKT